MTDNTHPAKPAHDAAPPPITQPERDGAGPLGPKDTGDPEDDFPDPDEYAGADDH